MIDYGFSLILLTCFFLCVLYFLFRKKKSRTEIIIINNTGLSSSRKKELIEEFNGYNKEFEKITGEVSLERERDYSTLIRMGEEEKFFKIKFEEKSNPPPFHVLVSELNFSVCFSKDTKIEEREKKLTGQVFSILFLTGESNDCHYFVMLKEKIVSQNDGKYFFIFDIYRKHRTF